MERVGSLTSVSSFLFSFTSNVDLPAIENFVIILMAMILHVNKLSLLEIGYAKFPKYIVPNTASILVTFSVLCILTKLRPFWPKNFRRIPMPIEFLFETIIILYAGEILLRYAWIPILRALSYLCQMAGHLTQSQKDSKSALAHFGKWIRDDFFFFARFVLATIIFLFMLDYVGILDEIRKNSKVMNFFGDQNEMNRKRRTFSRIGDLNRQKSLSRSRLRNFDPSDLPMVPPQDLISISQFVGSRQRQRSSQSRTGAIRSYND